MGNNPSALAVVYPEPGAIGPGRTLGLDSDKEAPARGWPAPSPAVPDSGTWAVPPPDAAAAGPSPSTGDTGLAPTSNARTPRLRSRTPANPLRLPGVRPKWRPDPDSAPAGISRPAGQGSRRVAEGRLASNQPERQSRKASTTRH